MWSGRLGLALLRVTKVPCCHVDSRALPVLLLLRIGRKAEAALSVRSSPSRSLCRFFSLLSFYTLGSTVRLFSRLILQAPRRSFPTAMSSDLLKPRFPALSAAVSLLLPRADLAGVSLRC